MILCDPTDSGGSDGRGSRISQAAVAPALDHLAQIKDTLQPWKVVHALREVLFLVVCGTIASGDDYEDIVDWGKAHLSFLRAALRHEPHRPEPVQGLFYVMGRAMLAG